MVAGSRNCHYNRPARRLINFYSFTERLKIIQTLIARNNAKKYCRWYLLKLINPFASMMSVRRSAKFQNVSTQNHM